jgi:hypothetical protein
MSVKELEERVIALENQVKQLQSDRAARHDAAGHDWQTTVEKFKNDEHVLAVLREAMQVREKERRAARRQATKSRRARS